MDEAVAADGGSVHVRARHISKRALKNKSVSVSFNEKDLKDYVSGFHKRKKKRRKEALQQQGEAERRKRIEQRKKRKLEREAVYGEAPTDSVADDAESDREHEDKEETEPVASVSGMTMYDNGDLQVMVTTSEIAREEEHPLIRSEPGKPQSVESEKTKQKLPVVKRKQVKKNQKKRSHPRPQSKRDKRKGKKKNVKQL